jgi:hypothetical protein
MSRRIRSIESSSAALAVLCIAGASSHANAATISAFVDSETYGNTSIAIDSSTAQFSYNVFLSSPFFSYPGGDQKATFNTALGSSGQIGPTNIAAVNPSASYSSGADTAAKNGSSLGTAYIQLAFLNGLGQQEYAFASFNSQGDLVSITGDINSVTLSAVAAPLPAAWALFVSGAGLLGCAAKRRRRRRKDAA